MGVKFIYGRAGSGKSTYCIEQIKKKIEGGSTNKLILLVPEQFTFQTENRLLSLIGESSVLRAEVLSFKRMAYRVFSECGGLTHKRMNDAGRAMLIYKILEELKGDMGIFFRASKQQGFVDIVTKTFSEFKKYNITPEILKKTSEQLGEEAEDLKLKIKDLVMIYNKYNEEIHKNYIDSDDELTMLNHKLDSCNIYDGAEIWIDEFSNFTPQQYDVLLKLMKRAKNISITLTGDTHSKQTDIFDVTANTEKKLLRLCEENRIPYDGYVDINNEIGHRFFNSNELNHLERYFFSYPFNTYNGQNGDIRIYKANNSYDEIETVAKDIIKLVRDKDYRYKDISLVCRNIDDYEKIVSVILSQYNIPYYIDKKRDVAGNPLIVIITSIFDIYLKNWSYESIFKYLKTGLVDIEQKYIDLLENYVLANGIKGSKWSEEYWNYSTTATLNRTNEIAGEELKKLILINDIKENIIAPLDKFYREIQGRKTVRQLCTSLYEFLLEQGIVTRINKWAETFEEKGIVDKAKEYSHILDIFIEVLDQAVEIMGEEIVSIEVFVKILNIGFERYEMGLIPVALDQVNIGDIAKIRSRNVKALYIIGANDGILPAVKKDEGILSDRDRELLKVSGIELAADTKYKAFEEQFLVYTVLTIPSNYLMVTYPVANFEGKSLRPSIIISRLKKIFPSIKEESDLFKIDNDRFEKIVAPNPTFNELIVALRREYDKEEIEDYWAQVYSWFNKSEKWKEKSSKMFKGLTYTNQDNNVSKLKIKKLYGRSEDKLMFSVSRIEKYAQCPFAYYVQYGLKAKDRKIYEFTPPDLGSFMHEILDQFTEHIKENNLKWNEITKEQCSTIISSLVDKEINKNPSSILNSSKRYQYFTDRFKKILTKSVTIISEHMKRSDFSIYKNEFEFGNFSDSEPIKLRLPSGEDIYLTGRIDRVDTVEIDGETYIRIIDYKSGNKNFDLNQLYYGLQIQLLVYLDALIKNSKYFIDKQVLPGAVLYFRIDDPVITSNKDLPQEEIEKEIMKKLKMNGLLLKDAKIIKAMDNTMEGYSLIIPAKFNKDGTFSKDSSVISKKQFDILREYVNSKMIDICEEMISGKIKINPAKQDNFIYCQYCTYSSICQFDKGLKDNNFNIIRKRDKEEVWKDIEERVAEKLKGEQ